MIFRPLGSYRRLSSCLLSASLLALWGCDSEGSSSGRAEALDSCNLELNEGYETWQAETQNGAKSYVFVVQATSESWGEDEDGETVREIRVSRFRNVVKDGRVIASSQNGASKVPTRKGAPSDAYTIEAFFEQLADLPCGDELDEFEEVLVSVDPERGDREQRV